MNQLFAPKNGLVSFYIYTNISNCMNDYCNRAIGIYCGGSHGVRVLSPVIELFGLYYLLFTRLCFNFFDRYQGLQ